MQQQVEERPWEKFDETNPRYNPPEFDFEKWLLQHSNWEDMESTIMFSPMSEQGGFSLISYDGYRSTQGSTLEEACLNYCKELYKHDCSFQ